MNRATMPAGMIAMALVLSFVSSEQRAVGRDVHPQTSMAPERYQGFLYGRVTGEDGATYQGRLRFGGDEEAFWGNYFNGVKARNPWSADAPLERSTGARPPLRLFGFEIPLGQRQVDLARPMMARFGDIARIDARGRDLRATLKSGTVIHVDRFGADDFADGLRIWDERRGVVDLDEWRIRSIEFLTTARLDDVPDRLHGTVRTAHGEFTGFIQWDREECVGSDQLAGRTADGDVRLRFDAIRSIARRSRERDAVTLLDGRELVLLEGGEAGNGHRGIYVDDRRYGRVLVSWAAADRLDFSRSDSGPAYDDFPQGRPLTGSVTTRAGRRLAGRLVYDLDESETTETLDAPALGVDYTIPFGLIRSIAPGGRDGRSPRATMTLRSGEELQLDLSGDLGGGNAGLLIFADGRQRPEYVPWSDVERIDF